MAKGRSKPKRVRSADAETNRYLNQLKREGYILELGAGGHWKIYLKCDKPLSEHYGGWHCKDCDMAVSTSSSPSVRILPKLMNEVRDGTQKILDRREQKAVECG